MPISSKVVRTHAELRQIWLSALFYGIWLTLFLALLHNLTDFLPSASDEFRYQRFASNLSQGFYTDHERPDLTNGPGYPLVLAVVPALGLPWVAGSFFNVLFVIGAVLYVHATLRLYVSRKWSLVGALFLAVYPPLLICLPRTITEPLAVMLVCGTAYHLCRAIGPSEEVHRRFHLVLCAAFLAYLALTKIFFGYVLGIAMVGTALLLLPRSTRAGARRLLIVSAIALALCVPWLAYTHRLTGQLFYWGSSGGDRTLLDDFTD